MEIHTVGLRLWILIFTYSLVIFGIIACRKDDQPPSRTTKEYLVLGHTYQNDVNIDERLEKLNYRLYDQIWLGGDICSETTKDESTLEYLDEIFDLGSKKTHWAVGNHDVRNGNLNWITDRTGRNTFYVAYFGGITLLVLNTNLAEGGNYDTVLVNQQYELIQNVCDTIMFSSHLIVFSHNAVWGTIDQTNFLGDYANVDHSQYFFRLMPNEQYEQAVYPRLVEVKQRGINVFHIAGDFGQKKGRYEYLSDDGIQFLGTGITSNTDYNEQFPSAGIPDQILILYHNLFTDSIGWRYQVLE